MSRNPDETQIKRVTIRSILNDNLPDRMLDRAEKLSEAITVEYLLLL